MPPDGGYRHGDRQCGGDRFDRGRSHRRRDVRTVDRQRPSALFAPPGLSPHRRCRDLRRLVDRRAVRFLRACRPARRGAGRGRAEHGSGRHAGQSAAGLSSAGLAVGRSVAADARVRALADPRFRRSVDLGRRADGGGADDGGPGGLHRRPRADPPALGVGAPGGRVPAGVGVLSPIRDGAHLHPSRPRRHADGLRLRAEGPELLELFPARGGEQLHRRVAGRARAAGAPRPAGLALRQSVLALRDRDRLLVRADLVDGRVVGRAGLRRALPRRGPVDEAQQLHPALRAEAHPALQRPVRAGRAPPFLERQLQVQQLDVLQHAAPPGSSRGLEPALSGAPAPRRRRIAATARELRQDVRARRIPAPLVPDDGPAGRRVARANSIPGSRTGALTTARPSTPVPTPSRSSTRSSRPRRA